MANTPSFSAEELQRIEELKELSSLPKLSTVFPTPKPKFEDPNYPGQSCCRRCHQLKKKQSHKCDEDEVDDNHSWEECVQNRGACIVCHPEEKARRTALLTEWKDARSTWEETQRTNHERDKRLWKLMKERKVQEEKNAKKAQKKKAQFDSPKFSSFLKLC